MDVCMYGGIDGWMDGRRHELMDGLVDWWMDGWMHL